LLEALAAAVHCTPDSIPAKSLMSKGMMTSMCTMYLMFFGLLATMATGSMFASDSAKNRPVSKVITLLKDMLKQLEKEAAEDQAIYEKMACWCETNDKEKTQSIKDAETRIDDLTTKIEELTASSARLNTEIKNLKSEVAENQDALDKATAIREKQISEFNAEEKDLVSSISSLKAAVGTLSKHHGGSLLQMPRNHLHKVASLLQHTLQTHKHFLEGALTHAQRRVVTSLLQAPDDYLDAAPTFKQSYAPQSGQIFGILKQMQETFEGNLATSQKEEMSNQQAYEELKAAKEEEINAGGDQIESKTQELATTDDKLAHAKGDVEDTKASLAADEEFLINLKEKCSMTDKEWEERQKTRQTEMGAVSKTLAVLSSDDAHDTFSTAFNPSLFQKHGASKNLRRSAAAELLASAAQKLNSPKLATLSYRVRLDAFTKVKKAIDDMVAQLLQEKADEIKHRDFCVDEFNTNELQMSKKDRAKKDLSAKIEDLELNLKELTEAIAKLKSEISEMQVQLKRAGEDREAQNKEFQMMVVEQRQTKKLLEKALGVLEGFYGKKSFMQQEQEPAGPPPPPGFKAYKKSEGSGSVMDMIQQIINDTKEMEAEAIRSEEDAQNAYEAFVKETNAGIQAKSEDIVSKSDLKAATEADLVEAKEDLGAVNIEIAQLEKYRTELHGSCDFVMKNFEMRQAARDEEVEALKQAKAILSGAKFSLFLQNA